MKKLFALLFTLIMSFNVLASCSLGGGDSLEISNITAVYDEETGETTITISYLDDIEEPLVFVVPKGEQGEIGNGILKIEPVDGEIEGTTDLMIYFTDGRQPQKVTVSNGKDGTSIANIKIVSEEPEGYPKGSKKVVFVDKNDNPIGDPFVIPAGKDGSEIDDIVGEKQNDGTVKVTVSYTDNNSKEFTIPAGRGIANIDSNILDNEYIIIITYTDNTVQPLTFTRPTGLLSGIGDPPPELGIIGDFYIDTENKIIFKKIGEYAWDNVINLKNERAPYKVKFTFDSGMSMAFGTSNEFTIEEGKCFISAGETIPIPSKTGYTFKGWYTTRSPQPTNGAFTDLTPITCDLVLFALWEENK
ncbi:MAG: hypothetical protein E7343_05045 [Clostridiales bacterium]|nr:hypothetical protein [Clostridiales bacterium]